MYIIAILLVDIKRKYNKRQVQHHYEYILRPSTLSTLLLEHQLAPAKLNITPEH